LEKLPEPLIDIVRETALRMGADAVAELAAMVNKDNLDAAAKLLHKIAEGQGTWTALKHSLDSRHVKPEQAARPEPIVFKRGRNSYAKLTTRNKIVQIDFASEEDAQSFSEAVQDFLRETAKR
jgi:hypothetical protein